MKAKGHALSYYNVKTMKHSLQSSGEIRVDSGRVAGGKGDAMGSRVNVIVLYLFSFVSIFFREGFGEQFFQSTFQNMHQLNV